MPFVIINILPCQKNLKTHTSINRPIRHKYQICDTLSRSPSLTANLTLPAATESSIRSADSSELVVINNPSAFVVLNLRIKSSVCVSDCLSRRISTCWVPLKESVGASFPQVGPEYENWNWKYDFLIVLLDKSSYLSKYKC